MESARSKFEEFHTRDVRDEGEFAPRFRIPRQAVRVGRAVNVLYDSDKLNPTTGEDEGWVNYIHKHKDGVKVYRCDLDGPMSRVPEWIWGCKSLVWLGDCAGFEYEDRNGEKIPAEATEPLPELYTTPDGKALLVVQSKKRVLALMWGGKLDVERRGIVG